MKTPIRAFTALALTLALAACGNGMGGQTSTPSATDTAAPAGSQAGTTDRGAGAATGTSGVTGVTGGGGGVPRN